MARRRHDLVVVGEPLLVAGDARLLLADDRGLFAELLDDGGVVKQELLPLQAERSAGRSRRAAARTPARSLIASSLGAQPADDVGAADVHAVRRGLDEGLLVGGPVGRAGEQLA